MNAKIVDEVITDFNGGEKQTSLLKWIIPPAAFLFLLILVLFYIANKDLILSKIENIFSRSKGASISQVENPDPSRSAVGDPIQDPMKSSLDPSKVSQTEQSSQAGSTENSDK